MLKTLQKRPEITECKYRTVNDFNYCTNFLNLSRRFFTNACRKVTLFLGINLAAG